MNSKNEAIQSMLEAAWLPKRAVRQDASCKLRYLVPEVPFTAEVRDAIQWDIEGQFSGEIQPYTVHELLRCQTCAVTPCGGYSYDVMYGLVRHLVLKGVAAKVVHLMDLENPPESRGGIDFMTGLNDCEILAVLGFYDSNEPKPDATRKVMHLLRQLDAKLLVETSDVLDAQTWWTYEFINSLGDVNYLIAQ